MAKNATYAAATLNAQADALARLLDNGHLVIREGATVLATLRFAAVSAPAAVNGVLTFNPMNPAAAASATAVVGADNFVAYRADGVTEVMAGSVGTADANLVLNSTAIQQGADVSITAGSFTHTITSADA